MDTCDIVFFEIQFAIRPTNDSRLSNSKRQLSITGASCPDLHFSGTSRYTPGWYGGLPKEDGTQRVKYFCKPCLRYPLVQIVASIKPKDGSNLPRWAVRLSGIKISIFTAQTTFMNEFLVLPSTSTYGRCPDVPMETSHGMSGLCWVFPPFMGRWSLPVAIALSRCLCLLQSQRNNHSSTFITLFLDVKTNTSYPGTS